MTFKELTSIAIKEYYPALFLEQVIPHRLQDRVRRIAWIVTGALFIALLSVYSLAGISPEYSGLLNVIYGLFFVALPFWMVIISLQAFYYSFYFKAVPDKNEKRPMPVMPFELANILFYSTQEDITESFLRTVEGQLIMRRAGISSEEVQEFVISRKNIPDGSTFSIPNQDHVGVVDYTQAIYAFDKEFADFLFTKSIQQKDFSAISQWVVEREVEAKKKKRWWSRNILGRIPGIGKNWSYGQTFYLDEYAMELPVIDITNYEIHETYGSKELEELESILIKGKGANAFLVGNDREGQLEIIARLKYMMEEGLAFPELTHKRIIVFDAELLGAAAHSKSEFETKLMELMNEAQYAGNVILVIPDFASFMASGEALGADIVAVLDRYFTSSTIHMIGLVDTERYHSIIERNAALGQRFDKILIEQIDSLNTIRVLENEIIPLEAQFGVFFTFLSLVAIAESAERYFPDAILPDRAVDLLVELAPQIAGRTDGMVTREDVLALVKVKTGIPVGDVTPEEREKLLNLEGILHHRIIGQDIAVDAIANAVRRARSGINNPNRPLASFLFLGPTGVGKTETTKALAEVFFGAEAKIERLDMSEYTSSESLSKLIGSFDSGKAGVLSTMLREHPYGVLLLDEFEKTTPDVMNLFLQILDEGMFSDMSGKKINARNLLIIATSNAGSDLIWEAVKHGDDLNHAKDIIIDSIIKASIMKPELINRFDGVIVFHPLQNEHLEKIARLQLEKLKKRLAERGINLVVTDDLVKYVMSYGVDPKFGARPMNRAIQDKVEQLIAERMIRGGMRPGAAIELYQQDLNR
ncbi:MAG: AAA family ATPase [Patescibacteria group bacterium]